MDRSPYDIGDAGREGRHPLAVGDVELFGEDLQAVLLHGLGGLAGLVHEDIGEDHARAVLRQCAADRGAQSASRSGHQCQSVFQSHVALRCRPAGQIFGVR